MREADIALDELDFEAMGIAELVNLSAEAGLQQLEELECEGTGAVIQCEVTDRYQEERLDELEYVHSWQHVAETEAGHLYLIEFTAPDLAPEIAGSAEELIGTCDPSVDATGVSVSLVGEQTDISEVIQAYQQSGVNPELERLGAYGEDTAPFAPLTERQREVVETAHELGFYEVPRQVSTEVIAAELDLDASTVAEHLQRAERHLIEELL